MEEFDSLNMPDIYRKISVGERLRGGEVAPVQGSPWENSRGLLEAVSGYRSVEAS